MWYPLAGPVVAAVVILNLGKANSELIDPNKSNKLSSKKWELIYKKLLLIVWRILIVLLYNCTIIQAEVDTIDRLNILKSQVY